MAARWHGTARHHVVVPERTEYVVDTGDRGDSERIYACRLVLSVTAEDVASFETDIPLASAWNWPGDVREAAAFLSSLKDPSRGEDALYRRTGRVPKTDRAWEAFVIVAPYAYDASAWSDDTQQIAALSDTAESIVAALTPDQTSVVGRAIGQDALVPLKQWRKRRR
ncbi:hypothetical protein EV646_105485 [Kribbella antiqua]|uniref:Uncharacterized protein n=1 Tax=Kribbella antiqua TaxID=2512217 RepID=A0A4R2IYE4_9ACTN|nr:hypothetical protein [Kribbella antiqua]TCO47925.1 hypothetical protein EV646_105485 [Kribbella antiqua]